MPLPIPEPGLVISYAYLWRAEYEQGQEEGTKDRPCVLILLTTDDEGDTIVTVVPVTHTPANPEDAVEIPEHTKQRLGLDPERSWIVVTEVNRFVWPGPDLRPISRNEPERFDYGLLPPSLFRRVRECLAACAAARRLKAVPRSD